MACEQFSTKPLILNNLHGFYPDGVDAGHIHAAHAEQRLPQRLFTPFLNGFGFLRILHLRRRLFPKLLALHRRQRSQNLPLVISDPLLDGIVHL